jgi:hypothetical protein
MSDVWAGLSHRCPLPVKKLTLMSLILSLSRTSVLLVYLTVCPALSSDQLPVLKDTTCRTSFQNLLDRPAFKRVDWVAYQACLEDRIPGNPVVNDKVSIDKCVEGLSSASQEALATSALKRRPHANPGPPLPAGTRDEIRIKIS